MPGRHVNDQQVRLYMTARMTRPQATAAAMAGISVATGRRIEHDPRPPSSRKAVRAVPDPHRSAGRASGTKTSSPCWRRLLALRPITILHELARRHPQRIDHAIRRTLERRIRTWRALHGPSARRCSPRRMRRAGWGCRTSPTGRTRRADRRRSRSITGSITSRWSIPASNMARSCSAARATPRWPRACRGARDPGRRACRASLRQLVGSVPQPVRR